MVNVRSPLKWIGGKYHSASRILAAFPPAHIYTTYLEPCGGAAHVLLAKPQYGHREIYNDLNDDLCNFWDQVQNNADELAVQLRALPVSRNLYYDYYARLFDGSQIPKVQRAVMWFYVIRFTGNGWLRDPPGGWNNTEANALAFRSALDLFKPVQDRLLHPRVILDDRDVERVIEEYDSSETLIYVDPPYRGAEYYYRIGSKGYAKKVFDHEHLAKLLNAVQGYVALSYYPYPELSEWYPADRWRRMTWQQHKPSSLDAKKDATELLLMNYPERFGGLFDQVPS